MATFVHPTASVSSEAVLHDGVHVGAFCVIEGKVTIGEGTKLVSHVYINGPVSIGKNNVLQPFSSIGAPPQDLGYKGSEGIVRIGDNNTIREGVTIHAPTAYTDATISADTVVGNDCLLMVNSHVAHNTVLHNNVILANNALLAGMCVVYDQAFISGNVVVHQGCRIGRNVMISGGSRVGRDIPPFMLLSSFYGMISGLNLIGLRRAGFTSEERAEAKEILKIFMEHKALNPAKEAIATAFQGRNSRSAQITLDFLSGCRRGISTFGSWNDEKAGSTPDF
ncbi:MAG: acyl-ACP--UDP-N-acetylglucosamine O-acyltransferase [Brevinema sp.]